MKRAVKNVDRLRRINSLFIENIKPCFIKILKIYSENFSGCELLSQMVVLSVLIFYFKLKLIFLMECGMDRYLVRHFLFRKLSAMESPKIRS